MSVVSRVGGGNCIRTEGVSPVRRVSLRLSSGGSVSSPEVGGEGVSVSDRGERLFYRSPPRPSSPVLGSFGDRGGFHRGGKGDRP